MTNDKFRELVTLYLEDAIDADALEQLNSELAHSPERVREFNDLRLLTGALPDFAREIAPPSSTKTIHTPHPVLWGAAASACLVIGLAIWLNQQTGVAPKNTPSRHARM
ncbi:MAG: hypothetical protein AAF492_24235, partial [Verrucomicrobiota bacterium]